MNDDDDLTRRLRDLGARPIEPAIASGHLTALATLLSRRRWTTRLKVAGAFGAGLLLGGTGLASAGALPDGAQEVAYQALGQVGIDVPPGKQRYNDPTVCPGGPYRNHGEYVREHPDDPEAGRSPCGKPLKSVQKTDETAKEHPGKAKGKTKDKSKESDDEDTDEVEEDEGPKGSNDPSPPATTESTLAPGSGPPTTTSTTTASSSTTTTSVPPPMTTTSTP